MRRIVLAGGSGFLGGILSRHLAGCGYEAVILSRVPRATTGAARQVPWDGRQLGDWTREIDGAMAVINLAGRSVNCRYHSRNRRTIMESRVDSTRVLGEAVARCENPPRIWLNSSTATIYRHSFDRPMDEATGQIDSTEEAKDVFSVEVAKAWEQAFNDAPTTATRKVALRMAMVFGTSAGTVFQVLRRLARLGLGGSMAGGRQFVSWIHEEDFCRAIEWILTHEDMSGPINVVAPNPLPNREMMHAFRHVAGMPLGMPASRWMLELGAFFLRTETELILKSRRVVPGRLLASGFQFRHPQLGEALAELTTRMKPDAGEGEP